MHPHKCHFIVDVQGLAHALKFGVRTGKFQRLTGEKGILTNEEGQRLLAISQIGQAIQVIWGQDPGFRRSETIGLEGIEKLGPTAASTVAVSAETALMLRMRVCTVWTESLCRTTF